MKLKTYYEVWIYPESGICKSRLAISQSERKDFDKRDDGSLILPIFNAIRLQYLANPAKIGDDGKIYGWDSALREWENHGFTAVSPVLPKSGKLITSWGCESLTVDSHSLDLADNVARQLKMIRKLDRVIAKYNLQYVFPRDILAQRVLALHKMGAVCANPMLFTHDRVVTQ